MDRVIRREKEAANRLARERELNPGGAGAHGARVEGKQTKGQKKQARLEKQKKEKEAAQVAEQARLAQNPPTGPSKRLSLIHI